MVESWGNKILRSQDITVTLGVLMTINTNIVPLEDYAPYIFILGTAFPTFTGIEAVQLTINGVNYPLIDNAGNLVVAGRLRDGRLDPCFNVRAAKYRLQFGSNGMPAVAPHFVVHEGLCPMRYNGLAGSDDNTSGIDAGWQ